jgi:phosphoribosyl 1,2-cyclic phosphodiesterase
MQVRLWGVRGSTPTPQMENLAYGGNTACVEVRSASGQLAIFDGGTGIRNLGQSLIQEYGKQKLSIHLLLTHYHWDHIQGIPFFLPLYQPTNDITFYAHSELGPLQERLEGQMCKPYFPVNLDMGGPRNFVEIDRPSLRIGDLTIYPFPLNHPQGAFGYRVEADGQSIVYASDLEHGDPRLDAVLRQFAQGADILIYDAQYTPEEYPDHRGWGHSTWLEGTRVARAAGVRQLILFHHDPWHNDQILLDVGRHARAEFENTLIASEGLAADLANPHWQANPCVASV